MYCPCENISIDVMSIGFMKACHTLGDFFCLRPADLLSETNRVKICRYISLPNTSRFFVAIAFRFGADSISAMLERRLVHVTLMTILTIGSGTLESRQIVLVHHTLADKARKDVLRSSTVRYHPTSPDFVQTSLNLPHNSRQVKIFCRPTKNSASVRRP